MNKTATVTVQVQFCELDPMGIVWHGRYVQYLETARCALLDTIDYNYAQMTASGYAWPIVDMNLRYSGSAVFEQKIQVTATLVEWENRLKINYVITDALTGKRLTRASTTQVAVELASQSLCFASPAILFEKLGLQP